MRLILAMLVVAITALSGCAAVINNPIALSKESVSSGSGKIGVAMSKVPEANTYFPGAACLLCIGVAEIAHSKLSSVVKTWSITDLVSLKQETFALLKKRGADVVLIEEPIKVNDFPSNSASGENLPRRDFSALRAKYGIDKLLVLDITATGVSRPYSSYIPAGLPVSMVSGLAMIVDLKTNTFNWYLPLTTTRQADGAWDEEPKFPGLTNAYFQTVETVRDLVLVTLKP